MIACSPGGIATVVWRARPLHRYVLAVTAEMAEMVEARRSEFGEEHVGSLAWLCRVVRRADVAPPTGGVSSW